MPSQPNHMYGGFRSLARHGRRNGNRQLHRLMTQACKLFLALHQEDVLKTFEVKALYKILFKYLGLLPITIL